MPFLEIPLAVAASSVTWAFTTNIRVKLNLNITAEQKTETLRAILEDTKTKHKRLVGELIPKVLSSNPDELAFQSEVTEHTELLIMTFETRLGQICGRIDAGGILSRLSPIFERGPISRLRKELTDLNGNTTESTALADEAIVKLSQDKAKQIEILKQKLIAKKKASDELKRKQQELNELLEGKREDVTLFSEETEDGLAELNLSWIR